MNIKENKGYQLFIVCPFCQLENFIRKYYGEVFFLTAPAAMYDFEGDNLEIVKEFIKRENIHKVYLVGDISSKFLKNGLDHTNISWLPCETKIRKLVSEGDTPKSLTAKILETEAEKWRAKNLFGKEIEAGNLSLHLLLSNKNADKIENI